MGSNPIVLKSNSTQFYIDLTFSYLCKNQYIEYETIPRCNKGSSVY